MLRLTISMIAAVAAAAAAGLLLPGAAPFLAQTPPAVLGAIAAIATLLVIDLSTRSLHDGRTDSQIRRLIAKSEALELELAALRAGAVSIGQSGSQVEPLSSIPQPLTATGLAAAPAMPRSNQTPVKSKQPENTVESKRALRQRTASAQEAGRIVPDAPRMTPAIDETLLDSVREALRADRIALHVQPIVDLSDRRTRFYECFSRLRTATGTLLTPQTYLPVVEAEGLTAAIDNMLLLRCVQLVRSAQRQDRPITFFCNISGQSLVDRVFFADFLEFASDNALLSNHLVFEIDHDTLENLPQDASRDLRSLADLGYRFAIDNANLANIDAALLTDHRVAFVKARVTSLAEHASRDRHLIDLERPLLLSGAELIATHIERDSHLSVLASLPVNFGQGFLFGEPAPIESLRRD